MRLLPDPQKQGEIQFILAKKLPYMRRMQCIFALIVVGILVQLLLQFWIGLLLLGSATALSLIKGYAAKPTMTRKEEWNQVTPDEYTKVKLKQAQLKKWDTDYFDITNDFGKALFGLLALFCAGVSFALVCNGREQMAWYWALDAMVILAPHWVTGVRTFLTKDKLIIKINMLEKVMAALAAPSDIHVLPMLSTREAKEGGRVPTDARLMVRLLNAPQYFLGVQIQISINTVQGKDYPYLYCVIIAKEEAGLFKKNQQVIVNPPRRVVIEETHSAGVDVLVIRQRTTRTTGYYTNMRAATSVVEYALSVARRLVHS